MADLHPAKESQHTVNRGLSWSQASCDIGQKKPILLLPAATIQFLGCSAHTPVTTPKIRESWNDSRKHVLENSDLHKSWILNKYLCHAPSSSSLKSTLMSNIRLKRKFSYWKKNSDQNCYFFECFCSVLRWSSEDGLKHFYISEGKKSLKNYTEHKRQKIEKQQFCFHL